MLFIIFVLVLSAVTLASWELLRPKVDLVGDRLGTTSRRVSTAPRESLVRRVARGTGTRLGRTFGRLLPQNFVRGVDRMLVMANEPWPLVGFLGAWAASTFAGLLLVVYIAAVKEGITALQVGTLAVALLPAFALLPYMVLRRRVINRQRAVVRALPDALDLLVTCVEAGMGVDAAFATVVDKTAGPLAESLSQYLKQAALGLSRREALRRVSERTGVAEFIGLSAAVSQGEDLGTPVADVLRLQAEDLRLARRERAHAAAQRAPVLMTIPLVVCFMPAMAAVVIVPSILNLVRFTGTIGGN
jgi:tight adherence protein C